MPTSYHRKVRLAVSGSNTPPRLPLGARVWLVLAFLVAGQTPAPPGHAAGRSGLYHGTTGQATTLERALAAVGPGHVVIVSEQHDLAAHHVNQLAVLLALRRVTLRVSVGMEFFYYPDQPWVDRFVRGEIGEDEFLRAIRWGGYPFDWYRPLVLFPRETGGQTRALNAPPRLTRAIAQRGIAGLSDEERALLPPGFQVGSEQYFERFAAAMRRHGNLPDAALRSYFAAQSAWDDTMAWQAREFLRAHPDQVLVSIVGDFHASYGGGLPDRLRARGVTDMLVISQVNRLGLSDDEALKLVAPDLTYGPRADYVWVTDEEPEGKAGQTVSLRVRSRPHQQHDPACLHGLAVLVHHLHGMLDDSTPGLRSQALLHCLHSDVHRVANEHRCIESPFLETQEGKQRAFVHARLDPEPRCDGEHEQPVSHALPEECVLRILLICVDLCEVA